MFQRVRNAKRQMFFLSSCGRDDAARTLNSKVNVMFTRIEVLEKGGINPKHKATNSADPREGEKSRLFVSQSVRESRCNVARCATIAVHVI